MSTPVERGTLQVGDLVVVDGSRAENQGRNHGGCSLSNSVREHKDQTAVVVSVGNQYEDDTHVKVKYADGMHSTCEPVEAFDRPGLVKNTRVRVTDGVLALGYSKAGDICYVKDGTIDNDGYIWLYNEKKSDLGYIAVSKVFPIVDCADDTEPNTEPADKQPHEYAKGDRVRLILGDSYDGTTYEAGETGTYNDGNSKSSCPYVIMDKDDVQAVLSRSAIEPLPVSEDPKHVPGPFEKTFRKVQEAILNDHFADVARYGWDTTAMDTILNDNQSKETTMSETNNPIYQNPLKALAQPLDDDTIVLRKAQLEDESGMPTNLGKSAILNDLYATKRADLAQRLRDAVEADEAAEAGTTVADAASSK